MSNALLSIGLEKLLCGKKAFVNFDQRLLQDGMHLALPRDTFVVEILESVDPTPDLVALCQGIHAMGYSIALDDFVSHPQFEPLTRFAELIKVDFRLTSKPEQERLLQIYKPRGILMLAEKVETYDEFEWALQAGYDLFQGFFFARPVLVSGREIPAVQAVCLRLLQETQRVEFDFSSLEILIRSDVSLAFKLLRYVNSALLGRRRKTSSITQALVILGEDGIRRWAALATLPILAAGKPDELVTLSIVRARFCERLAQIGGLAHESDAFIMGMFSLLDALIDCPLDQALHSIDLDVNIRNALSGTAAERDVLAGIYRLTLRYEEAAWDEIDSLSEACGVSPGAVGAAYVEATVWTSRLLGRGGV